MCLAKLKEFKVQSTHTDGSVEGWKVFCKSPRRKTLVGWFYSVKMKRGWNKADTSKTISGGFEPYRSGFHIFTTYKGAVAWSCNDNGDEVVVPVYFMPEDVTTKGVQGGHNCVVASRMWIEPHDYDAAVKK